ncbi:hypothetical protein LguiA_020025 [Lonicera macranthoides]
MPRNWWKKYSDLAQQNTHSDLPHCATTGEDSTTHQPPSQQTQNRPPTRPIRNSHPNSVTQLSPPTPPVEPSTRHPLPPCAGISRPDICGPSTLRPIACTPRAGRGGPWRRR